MTMQNTDHPSDEGLAALAGGEPEVVGGRGLHEHLESCDRCSALVDELRTLRAALAELPDLVPSRRLRLVPPVPEPQSRRGPLGVLRGIAGPVMVAGAGLALVGAVGLGSVVGMAGTGASVPALAEDQSGRGAMEGASSAPDSYGPQETPNTRGDTLDEAQPSALTDTSTPLPWLLLVGGGGVLIVGGWVLRSSINPRAG